MANTERLKTIQMLREARDAVGLVRIGAGLTANQLVILDKIYFKLDRLEGMLILNEIKTIVGKVNRESKDIENLADKMDKSVKKLGDIARKVKKAAGAVKGLINIARTAASAGLV